MSVFKRLKILGKVLNNKNLEAYYNFLEALEKRIEGVERREASLLRREREVEERLRLQLYKKLERAGEIIRRVGREEWVRAVRESRDER